jgi:hypothetical protein
VAISQVNVSSPSNQIIFTDTAMGNSVDGIKASSAKLYSVTVDNSANGGAACYVKLFNVASGSVVLGTTAPDEIVFVPAGAVVTRTFFTGAAAGVTFAAALSAACVTTGGTAGTTSPSSSVIVTVDYV